MKRIHLRILALALWLRWRSPGRVFPVGREAFPPALVALARSLAGAVALYGSVHAVSAATGLQIIQNGQAVLAPLGTNQVTLSGVRFTLQNSLFGPTVRYSFTELPPGLTGSAQGVVTGTPTQTGDFASFITGYTSAGAQNSASFVFVIVDEPPKIVTPPAAQAVTVGSPVTLTVKAAGTSLTYQWLRNGVNLPAPSGTAAAYVIASAQPADAGRYTVSVSNSGGSVTSAAAVLTVNAPSLQIVTGPAGASLHAGEDFALGVQAQATVPLAYQWRKDGAPLPNGLSNTLSLTAVTPPNAGAYTVVVSGGGASVTSRVANVFISPPPALSFAPPGTNGMLNLSVTSLPGRSYAWESRPAVGVGVWSPQTTVVATDNHTIFPIPGSVATNAFWHVRVVPITP